MYVAGGDEEASRMEFIPFAETTASEAVKSQRPQILTDLRTIKDLPTFDLHCTDKGCNSAIRYPLVTKREV